MITVNRPSYKGFLIIAALAVVNTVTITTLVATWTVSTHVGGRSQLGIAKAEMSTFSTAIELFKMDVGRYPTEAEGLQALIKQPAGEKNWEGPYLHQPKISLDPWGMPYMYHTRVNDQGETEFLIISYGPNRKQGPGNFAVNYGSNNIDPATWLSGKPAGR